MPKTPPLLLPALSMDDIDIPEWALDDPEQDSMNQELLATAMILEKEHGNIDHGNDELDNEHILEQDNADWQTFQQESYDQDANNNNNKTNQQNNDDARRQEQNIQQHDDNNLSPSQDSQKMTEPDIEEHLKEFAQNMINAVQMSIDCIRQVSEDSQNTLEGLRQYKEALATRGQELEKRWSSLRAHVASIACTGTQSDMGSAPF